MPEPTDKKSTKARLDDDNIPAIQQADSRKAVLDTEGVGRPSGDEKMSLDMEGVAVDKKSPKKKGVAAGEQKKEDGGGAAKDDGKHSVVERLKTLPLKKVAAGMAGLVLIAATVLIGLNYFLSTSDAPPADNASVLTSHAELMDAEPQENQGQEMAVALEPFIVALTSSARTSLLRVTVVLQTRRLYEQRLKHNNRLIRVSIYDCLKHVQREEVMDDGKRKNIEAQVMKAVNGALNETIVEDLTFEDLMVA